MSRGATNPVKISLALLLGLLLLTPLASGQGTKVLLRIQRLRVELATDTVSMSIGRNPYDAGSRRGLLDVNQYPNSATCLVVYDDGKYFFEKKEEHTLGKPKAKSLEGVLSEDELKYLLGLLNEEEVKKLTTPKMPDLPALATALEEAERLDVQVNRDAAVQQFTFMKERVRTGATITGSSAGGLRGMSTFLDSGAPYKKTVAPLLKWFEEIGKKGRLKEAKPQNCQ